MQKTPYRIDPENIEPNTFLKMSGPLTDKRILEVGCGNGRLTERYATYAKEIVAIDPNQEEIAIAKAKNPHPHVHFLTAGILDYADPESFDVVLLSWSL
ncbi:MAG: 2-polyprenyl-3-methyl-5-hydroxy-6-metoxy-1,4-benzoquinol methylase [Cellvibrionaceae bacterium]|jgi:2-polyprenyl-3-methyl-5-hydroxy-6-metoxy-1,4-benzoquinol methylase